MRLRNVATALGMAMVTAIGTASAAPTMGTTNLPIDETLIDGLKARGKTDADVQAFMVTLSGIQVYDDHKNPAADLRGDRTKAKIFWSAPYFTASPTRSVVGAEQFADTAIAVLDDADKLLASFELQALEFRRLQDLRREVNKKISDVDAALANPNLDPVARGSLDNLRPLLVAERATIEQQINDLVAQGSEGAAQLGTALRRSIANAFILQMSRLGLTPTADENAKLNSTDPNQWVLGLASLRARAGTGQYGLRQVIFEAGFTAQQRDALRLYLELRPDVTTRGLAVQNVAVRPTAQTLFNQAGIQVVRNAVMQLRGVNIANNGACGSTQSCNVVIEYTDVGARNARFLGGLSDATPVLTPVTFEAGVRVQEPDFVGSIFCNFKTGWKAEGRADVKDGAIIYDGDLSNKIKYDTIDSGFGGCALTVIEGDADSAFYHALMDIDAFYRQLHTERQQAAKDEKDAYRAHIEEELARHQQQSQNRSTGGWFSDVLGLVTRGSFLSGFAGFLLGETRDFYWHTTTLDTHSFDAINVRQSYSVHNLTATRKFAFDGFPLVCYTPVSGSLTKVMKACPDAQFGNAETEPEAGEEGCPETDIFGECVEN